MTEPIANPASRRSLRNEAATWFAIMRGPYAETRRAEFEHWLTASGLHREAYNRIAETFSLGKALKHAPPVALNPTRTGHLARPRRRGALAATLASLLVVGGFGLSYYREGTDLIHAGSPTHQGSQLPEPGLGVITLSTKVGEIRAFSLADRSVVTLDTDSQIRAALTGTRRTLTLLRGRGRFAVNHDGRPFVVEAGGGRVTAVGTLFDVALEPGGRVHVRLLSGAIRVAAAPRSADAHVVRRLGAGDAMSFGGQAAAATFHPQSPADADWTKGLRVYDGARLADVLADANRYATLPLRTASPDVGSLRISGVFRVDDARKLAANIADVLDLSPIVSPESIVLARRCASPKQENCAPPS
jgi:transmembrane sensor